MRALIQAIVVGAVTFASIGTLTACDGEPHETVTQPAGQQSGQDASGNQNGNVANLPDITSFEANKSDVVPIDLTHVYSVAPYLGAQAQMPHQGMHFNFHDDGTFAAVGDPTSYPAVYAIDDGTITHVETLREMGEHQAYGIGIVIAQSNGQQATLYYSLEPFVMEPSPGFFATMIDVKDGDQVKRGDVIGHLYVPPGSSQGTHLHLHLNVGQTNSVPALFTTDAVDAMHAHFGDPGGVEDGVVLPACTGYKITANENPLGTGASDCLN